MPNGRGFKWWGQLEGTYFKGISYFYERQRDVSSYGTSRSYSCGSSAFNFRQELNSSSTTTTKLPGEASPSSSS